LRSYGSVGLISVNNSKSDDQQADLEEETAGSTSPATPEENEDVNHQAQKVVIIELTSVNFQWEFNLLLMLLIISIAMTIVACIWMILSKNRSNTTVQLGISAGEVSTKKCYAAMP